MRPQRFAALLAFALLLAPAAVRAQQDAGVVAPQGDEAIVTVRVNGIERGEFMVVKAGTEFWMSAADFARLKIAAPAPRRNGFFPLGTLGARKIDFDEGALLLDLEFAGEALPATQVDLSPVPERPEVTAAPTSLILTYRLSQRNTAVAGSRTTAFTDLNVRVGPLLLRQESRIDSGGVLHGFTRGRTQAILDQPRDARRWTAGDVFSTAGPYGTSITGAGLLVSKVWSMNADAVRQPRGSIRATTALPAQVELAVDGATVYRGTVGPGPIEINNLQYAAGQRDLRLVVTDVNGRRQVIDQPFFFADSALAAGVHDYSYFIGRRSELAPDNRWTYREAAAQAFHRYGVTDSVTVGAGGEANPEFTTVGGGALLRTDALGVFSLDLLANRDRVLGRNRKGWSARYSYQTSLFAAVAGLRAFDRDFRSFPGIGSLAFPTRDARLALSLALGRTSLGLEWARVESSQERRTTAALRLFRNISRSAQLNAELRSTVVDGRRDNGVAISYRLYLDNIDWVAASADVSGSTRTLTAETGRHVPQSDGFGYRASVSDISGNGFSSRVAAANATLNLRPATIELAASGQTGGNTYGEVALSGALVAVSGHVGLSRQVGDSFLLARLGVPQPGVEVLLNNQVQGKTDANGQLFIPNVAAFDKQDVSVNDKQIPMTYQLGRHAVVIAPAFRSGTVVDFRMRAQRALVGRAWDVSHGQRTPIAQRSWTMKGPSGTLVIETTSTGDFYVEDAAPGHYEAKLVSGAAALTCQLDVAPTSEPVVELQEGLRCD